MLAWDEAETFVIQHDFMHLSFFKDDFREYVDTLVVALRPVQKAETLVGPLHPVATREVVLQQAEADACERSRVPRAGRFLKFSRRHPLSWKLWTPSQTRALSDRGSTA